MTSPARGRHKRAVMREFSAPEYMTLEQLEAESRSLIAADIASARRWACDRPNCDGLPHAGWLHNHARAAQREPDWDYVVWMILTGRGFGKTRTGAETCRKWAEEKPVHVCVMGETHTKVQDLCFEHPKSGLLNVIPPELQKTYRSSIGDVTLELTNGTVFRAFSAEKPDAPRGYAFDKAWFDEFAAMNLRVAQAAYDNVWFALREATEPQVVITTTPKPVPHVKKIIKRHREEIKDDPERKSRPKVVLTTGSMRDNIANLSDEAVQELEDEYAGTRLGRQELSGELLEDHPGALWELWMFEVAGFRLESKVVPQLARRVLSIDPAMTSGEHSDNTAMVVSGRDYGRSSLAPTDARPRGYVLHAEEFKALPEKSMQRAAELFWKYECDAVVVEVNNGGDYIPAVLRLTDPRIPIETVHATDGKRTRAQPVSALYEQSRISHVGRPKDFAPLEECITTWTDAPGEESPDLMDALVWGLWALFIDARPELAAAATSDRRLAGRR